jgi:uncharacterized delta-60 repeat protein
VTQVLGTDSSDVLYDLAVQPDGRIVVVGTGRRTPTSVLLYDWVVTRPNADGSRDTAFNGGALLYIDFIGAQDRATRVLLQPDGRIVVTGTATTLWDGVRDDSDFAAVRLNADGTLDTGFGSAGRATVGLAGSLEFANAAALQPDGKILIAGRVIADRASPNETLVARLNADGSLDPSFGTAGVRGFALSPLNDEAMDMVVQPDTRIVIAAAAQFEASRFQYALLRLGSDGTPDAGFGVGGVARTDIGALDDTARALAVQADGRIVVAGQASSDTVSDFGIVRYLADGTLDAIFGSGGVLRVDFLGSTDGANDVLIEPDGRIVAAGLTRNGSANQIGLIRMLP